MRFPPDVTSASGAPALAADQQTLAEKVKSIRIGSSEEQLRGLLGTPQLTTDKSVTYRDPPNRPDGPYDWYTFRIDHGKVTQMKQGGVACRM